MACRVLIMMDGVSFKGGAHFATLQKATLLHKNGFDITIFSGRIPDEDTIRDYPFIKIITPDALPDGGSGSLLDFINTFDIVCAPFEDSAFRKAVSLSSAYKIQWIHMNYSAWKDSSPYATKATKDDRRTYSRFDKIVFVSKAAQAGFCELYPELSGKTQVCYNLLDVGKIRSLADDDGDIETDDTFTIVTVSRMANIQKGIVRTLDIIERLKNEGYEFQWVFAGTGPDFDAIMRYCIALDLESHVVFLGHADNPHKYVKNADLFALLSNFEGNPLVIYESLLVGTPVISTYYNTDEAYTPPDTGWFVENDEQAIFDALKRLLDDKGLVREAREKLRGYEYDVEACGEAILEIFREGEVEK